MSRFVAIYVVLLSLGLSSMAFASTPTRSLNPHPTLRVGDKLTPLSVSLHRESLSLLPVRTSPYRPQTPPPRKGPKQVERQGPKQIEFQDPLVASFLGVGGCAVVGVGGSIGGGIAGAIIALIAIDFGSGLVMIPGFIIGSIASFPIGCSLGAGLSIAAYGKAMDYRGGAGPAILGGFAGALIGGAIGVGAVYISSRDPLIMTAFGLATGVSGIVPGAVTGYFVSHQLRANRRASLLPGGGGRTPLGFTVRF